MKRSSLLHISSIVGISSVISTASDVEAKVSLAVGLMPVIRPLLPPVDGTIPVAVLLSDEAVVIDFTGPWEVFQDVVVPRRALPRPFQLYTVAQTMAPIRASGGMTIVPNYSFDNAPAPKVLVIPAQSDPSASAIAWVRHVTKTTDITMSICTGAFLLAKTGLLSGKAATTHHSAYTELAADYPDVRVERGARFVEFDNIATSGGLSSGIDLALHVVERYFGHAIAANTADTMEYQGRGWMHPESNEAYTKRRLSSSQHHRCAVCEMDVDSKAAPELTYVGRIYYFCGEAHKKLFTENPHRFASES